MRTTSLAVVAFDPIQVLLLQNQQTTLSFQKTCYNFICKWCINTNIIANRLTIPTKTVHLSNVLHTNDTWLDYAATTWKHRFYI